MSQFQTTTVANWLDMFSYGFLKNPDPADDRDIYVSGRIVPPRKGIGQRLLKGETVEVEFYPTKTGGLQALTIRVDVDAPAADRLTGSPAHPSS